MRRLQGIPENTKIKLADMTDEQKDWLKKYIDMTEELSKARFNIKKSDILCSVIFLFGIITVVFTLFNIDTILLLLGDLWSGALILFLMMIFIYIGYTVVRATRHTQKILRALNAGEVYVEYLREGLRCRLKVYTEHCRFFEEEI